MMNFTVIIGTKGAKKSENAEKTLTGKIEGGIISII